MRLLKNHFNNLSLNVFICTKSCNVMLTRQKTMSVVCIYDNGRIISNDFDLHLINEKSTIRSTKIVLTNNNIVYLIK